VRYRVKPICFHWTLRTRSEIHQEEIRRSADLRDVMLAPNVNGDHEGKFDEDQPPAVAPTPAIDMAGFDFHLRTPLRGNTLRSEEKSQLQERLPRAEFRGRTGS
jgi:hypothetical protein